MLIFNAAGFGNPAEQVPQNGGRINSDNRLLGWPFWAQPFLPIVRIYALFRFLFWGNSKNEAQAEVAEAVRQRLVDPS